MNAETVVAVPWGWPAGLGVLRCDSRYPVSALSSASRCVLSVRVCFRSHQPPAIVDPHDDDEDVENYGDDTKGSTSNEFPDRKPCADISAERDSPAELAFTRTKSDPIECHCETRDQQCRERALPAPAAPRQRHHGS